MQRNPGSLLRITPMRLSGPFLEDEEAMLVAEGDGAAAVAARHAAPPTGSKAVKVAPLEAARLSPRGGGWAPTGWGLALGVPCRPQPPGAP